MDVIGTAEAGRIIGVSPLRVRQFIEDGRLKERQRVGKTILLSRKDVEAFAKVERREGRPAGSGKRKDS